MLQYEELSDDSDNEAEQLQATTTKTPDRFRPEQSNHADEVMALRLENKELRDELEDIKRRLKEVEDELRTKNVLDRTLTGEVVDDEDIEYQRQITIPSSSKKWSIFTKDEDEKIITFLKNSQVRHVGINSGIWEMMKIKVFPDSPHTVQSLENRYRKSIVPVLEKYFSKKAECDDFRHRVESPIKRRRI